MLVWLDGRMTTCEERAEECDSSVSLVARPLCFSLGAVVCHAHVQVKCPIEDCYRPDQA
jgi:hypothetical protein